MAKIENNPLYDILNQTRIKELEKAGKTTIFPIYKPKKDIGLEIFKALNCRLIDLGDGKLGIPMDDAAGMKVAKAALKSKVGLLSQCQGLQTLVSLVNDFDLVFDDTSYDTIHGRSIRNIMDAILKDIVNNLRLKDNTIDEDSDDTEDTLEKFKFDASPYDSSDFWIDFPSIETITWVLPTFFQILVIHAKAKQICKWEDNLIRIIRYGLHCITGAYIDGSKNPDGKGLKIGWNFTKDCEEPSLYFTFAVGECFMDMKTTFEKVLKYHYSKDYNRKYGIPIDETAMAEYDENRIKFGQEEIDFANNDKATARHDEYNEMIRLFRKINSEEAIEEQNINDVYKDISITSGPYGALEKQLKAVTGEIWKFVKEDLADKFFFNDLASTLTEEDLRKSTTSDVLFNTVYIANILIDGGMDKTLQHEEYAAEIKSTDASSSFEEQQKQKNIAREKQQEYENLLESCQLAVQRAFRTYESMKNDGKDYIVDQFLIGFNERFVTLKDRVNDLRKLRMRVFSLLPMLIHTNNVINAYLVKYPQVNMKKYAGYILENRFEKDSSQNKVEWIWEKDGYFSGSNYYYINALKELYEYYEEFESRYIDIGEDNEAHEKAYFEKLNRPNGVIGKLKTAHEKAVEEKDNRIKQLDNIIEDLKQQLEAEKKSKPTVEDTIKELIRNEINHNFVVTMTQVFNQAAKVFAPDTVDSTEDTDGLYAGLYAAMLDMFVAESYGKNASFKACDSKAYAEQTAYFKADIKNIINHNIDDINNDKDNRSTMYTILG